MKAIFQTANPTREAIPLREVVPYWFAVSSPLLGVLLGLLGAWFGYLAQCVTNAGSSYTH